MANPDTCKGCPGARCTAEGVHRRNVANNPEIQKALYQLADIVESYGDGALSIIHRRKDLGENGWLKDVCSAADIRDIIRKAEEIVKDHDYIGCKEHPGEMHRDMKKKFDCALNELKEWVAILDRIENVCVPEEES